MPYPEITHFLWLVHTARDWERDMERETMGFCVTLRAVHTTQGQGQVTIAFPGPVQCV